MILSLNKHSRYACHPGKNHLICSLNTNIIGEKKLKVKNKSEVINIVSNVVKRVERLKNGELDQVPPKCYEN